MISTQEATSQRISEMAQVINNALSATQEMMPKLINKTVPVENASGTDIIMGIGLVSNGKVSRGLNPSAIPMAIAATNLQREIQQNDYRSKIKVLIADTYAKQFHREYINAAYADDDELDRDPVAEAAVSIEQALGLLFIALGATADVEIIRTSDLETPNFETYEEQETYHLSRAVEEGAGLIVGWSSERAPLPGMPPVRDETVFHRHMDKEHPDLRGMSGRLYTVEGLSLTDQIKGQAQYVPPYFTTRVEAALGTIVDLEGLIDKKNQLKNFFKEVGRALRKILPGEKTDGKGDLQIVHELVREIATQV